MHTRCDAYLNMYPEACGMASTANQVDFFWGKFVREEKMQLSLEKHPLHLTGILLQITQNNMLLSSNMLVFSQIK